MSRLLAKSLTSSNMDSGRRSEMVLTDGLRFDKTAFFALLQSTYSDESCFDQNALSEFSFLNLGIFFFMVEIHLPFIFVHITRRDNTDQIFPYRKNKKQHSVDIGFTKRKIPGFLLRMIKIFRDNQWQIKKQLFTF